VLDTIAGEIFSWVDRHDTWIGTVPDVPRHAKPFARSRERAVRSPPGVRTSLALGSPPDLMPRNREDVENFLHRLNREFFVSDSGTFIVSTGDDGPPIALQVDDPIVLAMVRIGHIPKDEKRQLALFRRVLEYNAHDLAHASYGIDGDELVLDAGLQLQNLDENELGAVLGDIDLALMRHIRGLRELTLD
jgi:hypothetical protein